MAIGSSRPLAYVPLKRSAQHAFHMVNSHTKSNSGLPKIGDFRRFLFVVFGFGRPLASFWASKIVFEHPKILWTSKAVFGLLALIAQRPVGSQVTDPCC